jgi:hypothetical protein
MKQKPVLYYLKSESNIVNNHKLNVEIIITIIIILSYEAYHKINKNMASM